MYNSGVCVCVCVFGVGGGIWELAVLSGQFGYEPKTALKKLSLLIFSK